MVLRIYFCFCCLRFWCQIQKKPPPRPKSRKLPHMFSSRFYSFRSYIQVFNPLWVNFCISHFWDSGLVSFFCMWLSSFSSIIYWRDCPLVIAWFWLFYCKLRICICMSLFLGFLFLFHWSVCLLLFQYHTVLITVAL